MCIRDRFEASPKLVCSSCDEKNLLPSTERKLIDEAFMLYPEQIFAPRIISAENAYLITDMMGDVIKRGTGRRAYNILGREDLSGKTGTSNDRRDAWFAGFNQDIVAATWVGFDQERSLGRYEEGGRTALPMRIEFMQEALRGVENKKLEQPLGIVNVRINPESGLTTSSLSQETIFEKFRTDHVPQREIQESLLLSEKDLLDSPEDDEIKIESIF